MDTDEQRLGVPNTISLNRETEALAEELLRDSSPPTPWYDKAVPSLQHSEQLHQVETTQHKSALRSQVGGNHYKGLVIQPIEYCQRNRLGACETSIVRYASRWREKGGIEDLLKIKHYVDLLIELETTDYP